jgi:steroid 5-alpha reductase family enzyme
MTLWFVVSLISKRNDVADVAWGLGFVLLTWSSFFISGTHSTRGIIVGILVTLWGVRLARHIHTRNKGKPEDYRYQAWRQAWGKWFFLRSYLQVYLLQGVLLFLISTPVLILNRNNALPLGSLDYIGILIWLVGFTFETVGDAQLATFKQNPLNKGHLMQQGLWQYSRHPNYFGEVLGWWGIWLIALATPFAWIGIISPLTITILILKISGIPLLEKKMQLHPEFAAYQKRTSIFIPWFPKQDVQ